jgi:hypothetical protein
MEQKKTPLKGGVFYLNNYSLFFIFINMKLNEELLRIQSIMGLLNEQSLSTPEDDTAFLDWAKNATIMPFIAPNPYDGGDLKLGVQITGNDGKQLSVMDKSNPNQSKIINLIERLDVTTEDGKLVHRFENDGQDGSGDSLFGQTNFKPNYDVINNSYVVYANINQDSDFIQKLKQFTNKTNKFIVTVTPRLSDDLLSTGSKLFTTKPNILMVK